MNLYAPSPTDSHTVRWRRQRREVGGRTWWRSPFQATVTQKAGLNRLVSHSARQPTVSTQMAYEALLVTARLEQCRQIVMGVRGRDGSSSRHRL
jgi:hypothetical protein